MKSAPSTSSRASPQNIPRRPSTSSGNSKTGSTQLVPIIKPGIESGHNSRRDSKLNFGEPVRVAVKKNSPTKRISSRSNSQSSTPKSCLNSSASSRHGSKQGSFNRASSGTSNKQGSKTGGPPFNRFANSNSNRSSKSRVSGTRAASAKSSIQSSKQAILNNSSCNQNRLHSGQGSNSSVNKKECGQNTLKSGVGSDHSKQTSVSNLEQQNSGGNSKCKQFTGLLQGSEHSDKHTENLEKVEVIDVIEIKIQTSGLPYKFNDLSHPESEREIGNGRILNSTHFN